MDGGRAETMSLTIDTVVESELWSRFPALESCARDAVDACLAETGKRFDAPTEVSLLLCDDSRIRALNRDFRGLDKPTNVLSFPAPGGQGILGDIAVAYETVAREAEEENKPFRDHYAHMIVHGLLHLMGHDHEDDAEAEEMETIERAALRRMGIADPYAEPWERARP